MQTNETTHKWSELPESDKQLIVAANCMGYNTKKETEMRRAFDQGAPQITFGTKQGKTYFKIVDADVTRMQILINPIL